MSCLPAKINFPILGRKSVAHRRVRLCEIDHSRGGDPRAWRGCGGLLTPATGPGLPNKTVRHSVCYETSMLKSPGKMRAELDETGTMDELERLHIQVQIEALEG